MSAPRLYLDADFTAAARVALDEAQSRYLLQVMRLRAGAGVRVFNGRDGEWDAAMEVAGKRGAALALGAQTRTQAASPDLWLLFSPLKRQATDWLVEKATELGAAVLQPVILKRTVGETVRTERLAAIAREAAEQSERLDLPMVRVAAPLARALEGWDADRPLLYADEAGEEGGKPWGGQAGRAAPLLDALAALQGAKRLALLIGPEGGFDPAERTNLRGLSFVRPVSLGPRILRAETAAAAALAVIQAAWGDWRA
ncbi:MAG: 16S rRNA (uracil(1498)-N(3))-methyltransferase [Hyphomonadaceae bacterium]